MTEPCDLSAVEARRLIGRKRLSIELVESCIARIEMMNDCKRCCGGMLRSGQSGSACRDEP